MSRPEWNKAQRAYYDATAAEYARNFEQDNPFFRFVLRRYLGAVAPGPDDRILEIGASGGRFTMPLAESGCHVTAVDISPESIEYLRKLTRGHPRRDRLNLVVDDATKPSRLDGREFDAVVGAHILHHIEEVGPVLSQALRRLRPGGRVVFLEPNPANPMWYIQNTFCSNRSWRVEKGLLRCWRWRLLAHLRAAGFSDCRVESFSFFPPQIMNLFPRLERLEGPLERSFLSPLLALNIFQARRPEDGARAGILTE